MTKKQIDGSDWLESQDIVVDLIKNFKGHEQAIAFLLMGIGNLSKHFCQNVSEECFVEIMKKDPLVNMISDYSLEFMKAGHVLLKKYGIREKDDR